TITNINSLKASGNNRIIRMIQELNYYNFKLMHIPGENNVMADYLSRPFKTDDEHGNIDTDVDTAHNDYYLAFDPTTRKLIPDDDSYYQGRQEYERAFKPERYQPRLASLDNQAPQFCLAIFAQDVNKQQL